MGGLPLFFSIVIYNSYREGRVSVRMEASPFSIHLLYKNHIEKTDSVSECRPLPFPYSDYIQGIKRRQSLWQNEGLNPINIYKSYREDRVFVRMEASPSSIYLLYTKHKEKTESLSRCRPLSN